MPKVSVIVPMHNSADFLAEALASIERQSLRDIEVICVDDASTDATRDILELFMDGNPRFKLIEFAENRGAAAARNAAIREATGEYIAFMDDDDWYPEDTTLKKLYDAAVKSGASMAGGSFSEYENRLDEVKDDFSGEGHMGCFTFKEEGKLDYRDWQGDYGFQRFIYRRTLIVDNGIEFPPLIRHEDPVFLVKALLAAGWFYAIPDVVYRYRYHHKTRLMGERSYEDAYRGVAMVLALAEANGLSKLRDWQVDMLRQYAVEEIGLVFKEREFLRARSQIMLGIAKSGAYQQFADIMGSYRSFAKEVIRQHR